MEYLKSENYFCFATLLEMILNDFGYNEYTRFDIAEELGITLPSSAKGIVNKANYSNNELDWGIKINAENINRFFSKNHIKLHSEYIYATPYTMIEEDVKEWNQCHVVFLFSYGKLIGNLDLENLGHAALFLYMHSKQEVCIYDPGPKDCGKKIVNCYRLEEAMYQRRGGYILFQRI